MELSIFLARFLGIYILIFTTLWILRRKQINTLIEELFANRTILGVTGLVSLMLGLAIVISHPIWEFNWRGAITLFGYLAILKGIIRIGYPDRAKKFASKILRGVGCWIVKGILLLIGIYFIYNGFAV